MTNAFRLYIRYVGVSVRAQMQYRASFLMLSAGQFATSSIEFLAVLVLFSRFHTIQGWSVFEVGLLYGIVWSASAVSEACGRGFDTFGRFMVKTGEFDRVLLRPRSTALQMLGKELQLIRVGRFLQGMVVLVVSAHMLGIEWTGPKIALILLSILGGASMFCGLYVLQATLAFWTTESLEIMNTLTDGGRETGTYPMHVYRPWFRRLFTYAVPLACVTYFPVLAVLERADPLGSTALFQWLSPGNGFFFLLVALRAWRFGEKHYTSTGS